MRRYETIYIVDSNLEAEKIDAINSRLREFITSLEGRVIEEANWGKRSLSFEIKKRQYGTYVILSYEAPGEAVAEIERFLKLNQNVLRYLTIFISTRTLKKIDLDEARRLRDEERALLATQMSNKSEE